MSTAYQRLKSPPSLSWTSTHTTMVTLVNIMVMNGWLASFSFHVNRLSHSWDKDISEYDHETTGLRSWMWSKARSYSRPRILLTRFLFISDQSDQQFLRYSYFDIWPWNIQGHSRSWVRSKVRITHYTQYPTDALHFVSHQSNQPFLRYGQNSVWPWKHTLEFLKKLYKITVSNKTSPKSNQVITMT